MKTIVISIWLLMSLTLSSQSQDTASIIGFDTLIKSTKIWIDNEPTSFRIDSVLIYDSTGLIVEKRFGFRPKEFGSYTSEVIYYNGNKEKVRTEIINPFTFPLDGVYSKKRPDSILITYDKYEIAKIERFITEDIIEVDIYEYQKLPYSKMSSDSITLLRQIVTTRNEQPIKIVKYDYKYHY